jgi:hypothetical protein
MGDLRHTTNKSHSNDNDGFMVDGSRLVSPFNSKYTVHFYYRRFRNQQIIVQKILSNRVGDTAAVVQERPTEPSLTTMMLFD